MSNSENMFCPYCGASNNKSANFCSSCGKPLKAKNSLRLNSKQFLVIIIFATIIGAVAYSLQTWLQGHKPKQTATHSNQQSKAEKQISMSPEELFGKAEEAMQKIISSPNPEPSQILEAVDLLSRILSSEPENAWALLQMAELSFEQRIFDKSAQFYERYLKTDPNDNAVRTRYASSLTFSGKGEQALKELDLVLSKEPNNFQALAFSAIAYQQAGDIKKAEGLLAKAILAAPNEEAKNRLIKFAETLKNSPKDSPQAEKSKIESTENNKTFPSLDNFLRNHPIAGPKYVGLTISGSEIRVSFKDFPMDKMPPMVKDKFSVNTIAEAKKETQEKSYTLVFIDSSSGTEMHRAEINTALK